MRLVERGTPERGQKRCGGGVWRATVVSSGSTGSKLNSASLTCAQQQQHLVGTKTRKLSSCDT